jgi:hypothetical protein
MIDLPTLATQLFRKFPQGREMEDSLDFMGRPGVARFDEQDDIAPQLARLQRGIVQGELVSENKEGFFHGRMG